jgi:hypothetical protein
MKIPTEHAEFFWNALPGELPTEFVTHHRQHRMARFHQGEPDITKSLRKSVGAHVSGWMGSAPDTPAGVFASVFLEKLAPEQIESVLNGLHEIGRIEGQEWAEQMAATLEEQAYRWRR